MLETKELDIGQRRKGFTYRSDVGDTVKAGCDSAEAQSWNGTKQAKSLEERDADEAVDAGVDVHWRKGDLAVDKDGGSVHLGGGSKAGDGDGKGKEDLG
ncbi:Putative protein of unknown function [Podospora comata]|uniref:Uncharacterized protein n=1 Tax=Podospora comata TaxID=48703 RepID=A0ABY6S2U2_PODCO|nr:Putative protein of unknown function [Podospora comata]